MIEFSQIIETDILIAGSGLAGIRATKDALSSGKNVVLASKGKLCSGSSFYPLTGGLRAQLPSSERDKNLYLQELLSSGATVAGEEHCKILVDSITHEIERLPEIGIYPKSAYGRAACFATTERRLEGWSGWDTIRSSVRDIFSTEENLTLLEYCEIQRIIVRDKKVIGAIALDEKEKWVFISSKAIILATGGMCALYKHNLTTDDVCGIGHSLALDSGVSLVNLEFIQFIPGMLKPVYKLIFGEIILRYVDTIVNHEGRAVLKEFFENDEEYKTCLLERAMHGPFTCGDSSQYFDLLMMKDYIENSEPSGLTLTFKKGLIEDTNPLVKEIPTLYKKHHVDIEKEKITLLPFAHCNNGGISIETDGTTSIRGIFAAGEVAGGVHGADRHGGAATSAALVFGAISADSANIYCNNNQREEYDINLIKEDFASFAGVNTKNSLDSITLLEHLREKLFFSGNVYRNRENILTSLSWIEKMRGLYSPWNAISNRENIKAAMKTFHALRTSEALLKALLEREESRGPHYRSDFPSINRSLDTKKVFIKEVNGKILSTMN